MIRIPLQFVSQGPIDNKSVLIQVMAWCQTGTKPIPEPILSQFICGIGEDELNLMLIVNNRANSMFVPSQCVTL